jgi:hypothetical protein
MESKSWNLDKIFMNTKDKLNIEEENKDDLKSV